MQATGRSRDDLTPQQIDDTLGPEARRAWQTQRDDAFSVWQATHDLSTLTEDEIEARVAAVAPPSADKSSARSVTEENGTTYRVLLANVLVQAQNDELSPVERDRICRMDPVAEGAKHGNLMMRGVGRVDPFTGRLMTREWAIEQGYNMEQTIRQIQNGLCGPQGLRS